MRIGIISDTHGYWDDRFARHFEDCHLILHAGDIGDVSIIDRLSHIAPVRAVYGNIDTSDLRTLFPETDIFEIEGIRVLMTHIGGYPGKYYPPVKRKLVKLRQEGLPIKLFICGHSHILKVMPDPLLDLLHINPGAAGLHGWHTVQTLIKVDLTNGLISNLQVIELASDKRKKRPSK